MTINLEDNNPRIQYSVAQGVTQDTFAVPFEFFNDSDLIVYVDGVLKEEGVDYTITGGDGSTGNIEFVPAIPPEIQQVTGAVGGSQVIIFRRTAIERTSDFSSGADINRAALNEQLDILTAMVADAKDGIDRTIRSNPYEVAPNLSLPAIDDRKGRVLAFHETTGAVLSGPSIASVQSVSDSADAIDDVAANLPAILDAPNQASAAAASAAAALASEGAALVSENAASASASAALASENAAAALLDNFDDRYLGAKTSDPTLDNDGNALLLGALYYNSVDGVMKVYNGSVWLAAFASLAGTLIATNNLSDVANVSASRANLGLGTIATQNSNSVSITGGSIVGITDLAVADGGTGASNAADALVNLGLTATAAELNQLDTNTFTSDITIPDKIIHSGDTNTSIRFPANDTVTVETNGAERLRVDSSGNVGIGTSSPTTNFQIGAPSGGNRTFQMYSSGFTRGVMSTDGVNGIFSIGATNDTTTGILTFRTGSALAERMRITSAGNVGIGTSSPATALDVNGTANATNLTRGGSQVYSRNNILGTVTQSSGVPTGAIIQRGSNSNGEFARYADGTLICTFRIQLTRTSSVELDRTWTFPSSFAVAPRVTAMISDVSSSFAPAKTSVTGPQGSGVASTTNQTLQLFRIGGTPTDFASGDTCFVDALAVGRWF